MKLRNQLLFIFIFIVFLYGCSSFDGSRIGNENELMMDYQIFNKTEKQDINVEKGQNIHVEVIVDDGSLSMKIQKDDQEPIYESNGIFTSAEFDVVAKESGIYTVTVIGNKTKGSFHLTTEE